MTKTFSKKIDNIKYIEKINWNSDDGVNMPMINDVLRNCFYEKILSKHVKNKKCTDIGFGTGLLSMIALKHGAAHIRAFESNNDRYHLGKEIIDRLKLTQKIELVNDRYTNAVAATEITFSETVSHSLWGENMYFNLPNTDHNTLLLPSEYGVDIYVTELSNNLTHGLINSLENFDYSNQTHFAPGIDLSDQFVELIAELSGKTILNLSNAMSENTKLIMLDYQTPTAWGWKTAEIISKLGNLVASYSISTQPTNDKIELTIDVRKWKAKNILITPKCFVKHQEDKLYLSDANWGPAPHPVILIHAEKELKICHSLKTGKLIYLDA